jgi:hypothetical protein
MAGTSTVVYLKSIDFLLQVGAEYVINQSSLCEYALHVNF